MICLGLKTDQPEAEIVVMEDGVVRASRRWQAHRQLAETIHVQLDEVMAEAGLTAENIDGLVGYKGPGSFTGLRIGLSVVNAMAYALTVPVVGATGQSWIDDGAARLAKGDDEHQVVPEYGAPVHITPPKH